MTRHLVTAGILLVALALYAMGLAGAGIAAFIVGMVFEGWFWVRLITRRQPVPRPTKS